jgi:Na+-driven multidrug efflux pump
MMLMTARLWVFRIPLVIILKNTTNLQEKSIWFAMIISNVLICMISFGMYLTGRWQNKVIKDNKLKDKVSIGEV